MNENKRARISEHINFYEALFSAKYGNSSVADLIGEVVPESFYPEEIAEIIRITKVDGEGELTAFELVYNALRVGFSKGYQVAIEA